MIIGIDDSGNFQNDKMSFYAAAFIRPKKYEKIKKVFLKWEAGLPESAKSNGEVKGHLLTDTQLADFADRILTNNGHGAIKAQAFGIEINKQNTASLEAQRTLNLKQIREQTKKVYRDEGPEYTQIATFYEQMAAWLQSKSIKTLYKLQLLSIAIVKSLNLAIITSSLRGFDKELGKLEINIDQGITGRPSVEQYWKDIMRTAFWNLTSTIEPIIHLTEWRSNHPFIKRFYKYPESPESMSVFTQEIRGVFNFFDSEVRYEIRIADIVANAYFRKYVLDEELEKSFNLIASRRVRFDAPYVLVKLGKMPNPNPVNPYTDRIGGVTADELEEKYG